MARGQCFVDDDNGRRGLCVVSGKGAAFHHAHAHCCEVIGIDDPVFGHRPLSRQRWRAAIDVEAGRATTIEWNVGHDAGRAYPRDVAQPLEQSIVEGDLFFALRIFRHRKRDERGQDMVGFESGIDREQTRETSDHQSRPDQEYERERDLRDHEQRAHPLTARRIASAAAAFFQSFVQIGLRDLPRRREAEEHTRQHGDGCGEEKHGAIHANLGEARQVARLQ
jgi:hypothetical protein